MKTIISDKDYNKYLHGDKVCVTDKRLRPAGENFIAALNTVDMSATPVRQETMRIFRELTQ